ncbi:MAG: TIGR01777 family oxidoreductase [Chitinophagaceae bacterium]|nr:TIGR01777 family oxidoreductase [Chitinophagaceae bacterium]MBP9740229.1 TIGR01777 family oxidoreductase [Chitinophagaceae bacterium]
MKTVLITGGTGLVGSRLTELLLARNYHVIVLSRSKKETSTPNLSYAIWNVEEQTIDASVFTKTDYIVHLAGAGVADKRWSVSRKKEILDSRIQSSALLVKALQQNSNKVQAVISSSAIGWYGPDPSLHSNGFEEVDAPFSDYLGNTCKLWEESIEPITQQNIRLVKLRTGIVLSTKGGALKEFLNPIKMGIAAILGNGKQIISWIHIDDLCNQFIYAIEHENMQGSYNAVAPNPVNNKILTLSIAKKVKGKFYIPIYVPSFMLKIILGEMSIEVLKSTTVSSKKIEIAGFNFKYKTIDAALSNLLNK